jgi:hypothetical protein
MQFISALKNVPFRYGFYVIRRRFVSRLRERPRIDYNEIVQADTLSGLVTVCPLGLLGVNGSGYAAVDEGYGIVSANHIKSIPKQDKLI